MKSMDTTVSTKLNNITQSEILPCILLLLSTIIALVMANTPLKSVYTYLFNDINIFFNMNLNAFINDFLMAVFFFSCGV